MTALDPHPLDVAIKAARAAGDSIRAEYEKDQIVREKADHSLATETDTRAEKIIMATIQAAFPDHAIFSEETGSVAGSADHRWIIDPLDGTLNFIRHLPGVAVSIAFVQDGQAVLGVVYDVIHDKLFTAETGQGAALNGQPIHVSEETTTAETVVSFARGSQDKERLAALFTRINSAIRAPRVTGSTALSICSVAVGHHDAHVSNDCYLYDCLAPALIAREAGATIINFAGQPWRPDLTTPTSTSDLIVANRELGQALVKLLD